MIKSDGLSSSDKKQLAALVIWLIAGIAMIIIGIVALLNRSRTMETVSGALGACSLITGIITIMVRIFQGRTTGKNKFSLDGIIWLVLAFLLFNTDILNKLGKIAFVIGGIILLLEGIRSLAAAVREKSDEEWYVPRILFSVAFMVLGIVVIMNAQTIFESMIVLAIGIYFIIQGTIILYEWIGRAKYFRNFRGLDGHD